MTMYSKTKDLIKAGIAGAVSASFAIEGFGLNHLFTIHPSDADERYLKLLSNFSR